MPLSRSRTEVRERSIDQHTLKAWKKSRDRLWWRWLKWRYDFTTIHVDTFDESKPPTGGAKEPWLIRRLLSFLRHTNGIGDGVKELTLRGHPEGAHFEPPNLGTNALFRILVLLPELRSLRIIGYDHDSIVTRPPRRKPFGPQHGDSPPDLSHIREVFCATSARRLLSELQGSQSIRVLQLDEAVYDDHLRWNRPADLGATFDALNRLGQARNELEQLGLYVGGSDITSLKDLPLDFPKLETLIIMTDVHPFSVRLSFLVSYTMAYVLGTAASSGNYWRLLHSHTIIAHFLVVRRANLHQTDR